MEKSNRKRSLRIIVLGLLAIILISNTRAGDKPDWPREIKTNEAKIVIYQPQVENFSDVLLEARAAVAVDMKKGDGPVFGAVWFNSELFTDLEKREVLLKDLVVKKMKFPEVEDEQREKLVNILESEVPKWEIKLSLDRLLASIDKDGVSTAGADYNHHAPEVLFSTEPSILVVIDGDPIYREIKGFAKYKYVLNSPFFICTSNEKDFFLYGDRVWYKTSDLYGEWKKTSFAPQELKQMMEEEEKSKAKEMGAPDGPPRAAKIYVRSHPAELLQSLGTPKYNPVEGTDLLHMSNTENDIIMDINSQTYYILISGRWYYSASLNSENWEFIDSRELPEYFSTIPVDSDIANVRSSVAGTEEAMDATLENTIPQTAEIDRNTAKAEVEYDGNPSFEPIEGTGMSYAVNTEKSVLLLDNRYYVCDEGVWFTAYHANGPWTVCVDIPGEFQNIPSTYPVYHVKYVKVYNYTPQYVYVGYTPGYCGSYVYNGVVVYGTGYYYRPWYSVHYYPRHVTWGYGVHYSPYTGWGYSYGISYGWFSVSYRTGPYHYNAYWGPAGYRSGYRYGYGRGYHHGYSSGYVAGAHAGYSDSHYGHRSSSNVYRNRESGVHRAGTRPSSSSDRRTVDRNDNVRRSDREVPRGNDVYTDRDGNVHRRTDEGWEKRGEGGRWEGEGDNRASRNSDGRANPNNRSSDPNKDRGNSSNANRNNKDRGNSSNANSNNKDKANQGNTGNRGSGTGDYNRSGSSSNKSRESAGQGKSTRNKSLEKSQQSRSKGSARTREYNQSGSSSGRSSSARSSGSARSRSSASRSSSRGRR